MYLRIVTAAVIIAILGVRQGRQRSAANGTAWRGLHGVTLTFAHEEKKPCHDPTAKPTTADVL